MPMTCARCGAQNPDGNQFCSACGTPLTQAAAGAPSAAPPPPSWLAAPPQAPPPQAAAPPVVYAEQAPVAYASPYYSPAGAMPQAPVHRTPWVIIISAVVLLIVLLAGGGTAIALFSGKASFGGGTPSDPGPVASPSPWTGPTTSNPVLTVPVPPGWTVSSKDNESISLTDPNGWGYVSVGSGVQSPKLTVQQQKGIIEASIKAKSPDAVECRAVRPTPGALGGVQGIFWHLCFTVISAGKSLAAEASLWVATNADGSVWYGVILLTPQSYMTNLTTEAAPILAGIEWKLK